VSIALSLTSVGSTPGQPDSWHPTTVGLLSRAQAPLSGITIVIDPGHQLGNANHPEEISQQVDAGGFTKDCNTTGTATNSGYPESTFAFRVASRVRKRLQDLGARVVMTRHRNSRELWGPCIDVRGKLGNRGFRGWDSAADLKVSIHGDGSSAGNRGFHIIVATGAERRAASRVLAKATRNALVRAGFPRSNYVGGGTALSFRGDLGTLNLSRMPAVMLELGNMRNADDAAVMTSRAGRSRYATAIVRGIRRYLDR
jgi:N-acetylmuramoyl-L-alanine amidase